MLGSGRSSVRLTAIGFIPIVGFAAAIVLAVLLKPSGTAVYNPPSLLPVLNTVFITGTAVMVAALCARSYLATGQRTLLLVGAGLLALGLSAFAAGWLTSNSQDYGVAVFNFGALICAAALLVGALLGIRLLPPVPTPKGGAGVAGAYSVVSVIVLAWTSLVLSGAAPAFFTSTGPTLLRQLVLGAAIIMFVLGGLIFFRHYLESRSRVMYWYSLALGLLVVGLSGVLLEPQVSGVLSWIGRIAQYTGGFYFIIALWTLRTAGYRDVGLAERWANAFRNDSKQSAALLANMLNALVYGRVERDADGKPTDIVILDVNGAFERSIGLKREEAVGRKVSDLVPGQITDPTGWYAAHVKVAATGESMQMESYLEPVRKWFSVSAYSPQKWHFVSVFEDITARKRAELEKEHNQAILEGINRIFREVITAEKDEDVGLACLSVAENLTHSKFGFIGHLNSEGLMDDDAISDQGWDACAMADPKGHGRLPVNFMVQGLYGAIVTDGKAFYTNDPRSHPSSKGVPPGHPRLTAFLGVPLRHAGEIIGTIGLANKEGGYTDDDLLAIETMAPTVVEALARRKAEREFKESEERFSKAFHAIPTAMTITNLRTGRWVDVNESFVRLTGYPREELIGRTSAELGMVVDLPGRAINTESLRSEGAILNKEISARDRSGKNLSLLLSSVAITINGEPHVASALVDLTDRKRMEADLEDTANKYSALFDTTSDGIWINSLDGRIIEVNDAYCRMSGYSHEELTGMSISTVEAIESPMEVAIRIDKMQKGSGHDRFESRHRRKDGSVFDVDITILYLERGGGQIAIFVRDITERKKAEEALKEERDRLSSLINSISDEVWFADGEGRFTLMNPSAVREFNLDANGNGVNVNDLAESLEVLRPDGSPRPVEETPSLRALKGEVIRELEEVIRTPATGELRHRQVSAAPVREAGGRIIGSVSVVRDVTERKRAEERLKLSEEKANAMIRYAPTGIYEIDYRVPKFIAVNDAMCRILGYTREELLAMDPFAMLDEESRMRFGERIKKQLAGEKIDDQVEYRTFAKDGREVYATLNVMFTHNEGRPEGALVVAHDVTERRRMLDELKRSNAELQQFAYIASHDLQEPLRMVSTYLGLLNRKYGAELNENAKEYMVHVLDGAGRMRELIDDLLEYSRVDSQGKPFGPVDMNQVTDETIETLRLQALESKADIYVERLPTIMADETQMLQVMQNLVGNAIKFHGKEKPRIHISATQNSSEWVIEVKDNGIGLNMAYADKIFQMFQRLHSRGEYPGTGVGLAISKKIVERHGGRIWVESEEERGSTLFFSIPKRRAP